MLLIVVTFGSQNIVKLTTKTKKRIAALTNGHIATPFIALAGPALCSVIDSMEPLPQEAQTQKRLFHTVFISVDAISHFVPTAFDVIFHSLSKRIHQNLANNKSSFTLILQDISKIFFSLRQCRLNFNSRIYTTYNIH